MPLTSIESYESTRDANGFTHWVSIDPLTEKDKGCFQQYTGRIKSSGGPRDTRDSTLVRATFLRRERSTSAEWAQHEVEKAATVQRFAKEFNRIDSDELYGKAYRRCFQIQVLQPQICRIESRSPLHKKRIKDEVFIFEDKIKSSDMYTFVEASAETYGSNSVLLNQHQRKTSTEKVIYDVKNVNYIRNNHKTEQLKENIYDSTTVDPAFELKRICSHKQNDRTSRRNSEHKSAPLSAKTKSSEYLQAFVHYFFHHHKGGKAVDCLQGAYDRDSGYILTRPTVHSLARVYGQSDRGLEGICTVIRSHVCTRLCGALPGMMETFMENFVDKNNNDSFGKNTNIPTSSITHKDATSLICQETDYFPGNNATELFGKETTNFLDKNVTEFFGNDISSYGKNITITNFLDKYAMDSLTKPNNNDT